MSNFLTFWSNRIVYEFFTCWKLPRPILSKECHSEANRGHQRPRRFEESPSRENPQIGEQRDDITHSQGEKILYGDVLRRKVMLSSVFCWWPPRNRFIVSSCQVYTDIIGAERSPTNEWILSHQDLSCSLRYSRIHGFRWENQSQFSIEVAKLVSATQVLFG